MTAIHADDRTEGWLRLNPLTVWTSVVVLAAVVLLPAVVVAVVIGIVGAFWPWGLIPLGGGLLLFAVITGHEALRFRATTYRVTADRFELRSGVLARRHRFLRRDRIRNVVVATPVWARPFGLCQVIVGSGESSTDELKLDLVSASEGNRLRQELLRRGALRGEEEPSSNRLVVMRPAWFRYGLLSPLSVTAGYSALAAALGIVADFFAANVVEAATMAPIRVVIVAGLLGLIGAVVTGAVLALLLHTEAWWNFRLTREPDGTLLVRRGLLNLSSISIEENRMRGIQFREYLPLRWLGAASLAAVVSGFKDSGNKAGLVPKRTLTPDMPRAEALRVAALALPGAEPGSLIPHPRAALRRRLVRAAAAVVVLAVATVIAGWLAPWVPTWAVVVFNVLALVVAGPYAVGSYRGLGHALSERFLFLRRGMTARSTAVLKREALIGWTFSQSPFQRRSDLTTVGAMVAAGKGVYRAVDTGTSDGLALANAAVPGLLEQFLERR